MEDRLTGTANALSQRASAVAHMTVTQCALDTLLIGQAAAAGCAPNQSGSPHSRAQAAEAAGDGLEHVSGHRHPARSGKRCGTSIGTNHIRHGTGGVFDRRQLVDLRLEGSHPFLPLHLSRRMPAQVARGAPARARTKVSLTCRMRGRLTFLVVDAVLHAMMLRLAIYPVEHSATCWRPAGNAQRDFK